MDLTLFVCGAALFDSFATATQIILLVLLFSTEKPVANSLGFLAGVTLTYLVCGLVGLALVDRLGDLVRLFVPDLNAVPDGAYYQSQLILGLAFLAGGPLYALWAKKSKRPPMEHQLLARIRRMNFGVAFGLGAVLTAFSFPMALPYVAALEKIAAAHLAAPAAIGYIGLYVFAYDLPLLVLFGLFVVLREAVLPRIHLHVRRFNLIVNMTLFAGFGLIMAADSAAYFWTGKALMATRFL